MKYAYEDLSEGQFETLVVFICQRLLGVGVQGFAKGPDGGKDARFEGTAELLPSKAAPWNGITVIQAKHTNGYNRTFSEPDFYSVAAKNSVVAKEIPRIRKLRDSNQMDHYMLFANRRLAGNADAAIRTYLAAEVNLPTSSIYLCGVEQLEVWLKTWPDIPAKAGLDPVDSPLIVSPDELAEVVEALALRNADLDSLIEDPPTPRVSYDKKNTINNMSADYAKNLVQRYLKETRQIHAFLASPENAHLLRLYESVAEEFQLKIIAKRKEYQSFDEVMNYLFDLLFNRDPVLRQHKRLTRAVLFYMYWSCDIGGEDDASTD